MPSRRHHQQRLRNSRRRWALRPLAPAPASPLLRGLDIAMGWLLGHPRLARILGALLAALLLAWSLSANADPSPGATALSGSGMPMSISVPTASVDEHQAVLTVVAAYNQASISAGQLGRAELLAPYLTPDGSAWAQVQTEFARRGAEGESHVATLTRWGLLELRIEEERATVVTQEQWDDRTLVVGQVTASRRGLLSRNTYHLVHTTEGWRIEAIETTVVLG